MLFLFFLCLLSNLFFLKCRVLGKSDSVGCNVMTAFGGVLVEKKLYQPFTYHVLLNPYKYPLVLVLHQRRQLRLRGVKINKGN